MKTYITILLKKLEQMQIEVVAASKMELSEKTAFYQEQVYDCHRILLIRSGKGRLHARKREYELVPGTFCILLAGTSHSIAVEPGETLSFQWCHLHANLEDREFYSSFGLPVAVQLEERQLASAIFDRLISEQNRDGLTSRLRIKAAILELMSMYLEGVPSDLERAHPSPEIEKIDAVLKYIDDHLADNITVEVLARQVFLHPNYFIVFFKSVLGYSPIQYVNNRRMEYAKSLLLKPDCSISEVAASVGMQIYYFSRMFKAHTGLTPSRYRKQATGIVPSSLAEFEEEWGSEL
jgi:AraC-like DNA-binding protein